MSGMMIAPTTEIVMTPAASDSCQSQIERDRALLREGRREALDSALRAVVVNATGRSPGLGVGDGEPVAHSTDGLDVSRASG